LPHRTRIRTLPPSARRKRDRRDRKIVKRAGNRVAERAIRHDQANQPERHTISPILARIISAIPRLLLGISFGMVLAAFPNEIRRQIVAGDASTWMPLASMVIALAISFTFGPGVVSRVASNRNAKRIGEWFSARLTRFLGGDDWSKFAADLAPSVALFFSGLMIATLPLAVALVAATWRGADSQFVFPPITLCMPLFILSFAASMPAMASIAVAAHCFRGSKHVQEHYRVVSNFLLGTLLGLVFNRLLGEIGLPCAMRLFVASVPCFVAAPIPSFQTKSGA